MHDRGRYLQDRGRLLLMQELFNQANTANVWEPPSSSGANIQHVTWSAQDAKDFLLNIQIESAGTIDTLPQETNKEQPAATKRKKRLCLGKWRESNKRRRRPCSLQAQAALRPH